MTDLREKIADVLDEWVKSVLDYSNYEGGIPNTICDIADRILALLPKVPELQWDGKYLKLGEFPLGSVQLHNYSARWWAHILTTGSFASFEEFKEARAAVEAAVRKALGWEA